MSRRFLVAPCRNKTLAIRCQSESLQLLYQKFYGNMKNKEITKETKINFNMQSIRCESK